MSVKHKWSILCNNSIIDDETHNLSIINIVDQLTIGIKKELWDKKKSNDLGFVVSIPLQLVTLWSKDKGEKIDAEVKYEFINAKSVVLHTMTHGLLIDEQFKTMRYRASITNLNVIESGSHTFVVYIKEKGKKEFKKVEEVALEVVLNIVE